MRPIAAAMAKRMLLRNPIVRMVSAFIGIRAPVFEQGLDPITSLALL
jgi:hypothetical protein